MFPVVRYDDIIWSQIDLIKAVAQCRYRESHQSHNLTSLVIAVVHRAEDVLSPGHRLVAPTHSALGAAGPVAVGAVIAHPLLLGAILLAAILCRLHLSRNKAV